MQRLLPFPRIAVGACALFMLGGTAQGSEFTVTKTNDTASTCDDGDCSLREAIIAANANGTADIINLTTGTYTLTIAGTPEEGALTGDLDITKNLTINGSGTVIDGGEMNRVFDIHQGTVTFNGLTIQNGKAQVNNGGGIRNAGTLTINDSTIQNNVGRYGAGIHNSRYGVSDSNAQGGPSYSFTDISGSGTIVDGAEGATSLSFNFDYYGNTYNQVHISEEGYLSFSAGNLTDSSNTPLPYDGELYNSIAPFWDNLSLDGAEGGGNIYAQTLGNSPNRQFVIQYHNVSAYYGGSYYPLTFQAILNESDNSILFQYADVESSSSDATQGSGATVGIVGPEDNRDAVQYSYNSAVLTDGLAIRFTPEDGVLNLNNVTVQGNDSTDTATGNSDNIEGAGLYNTGTATITDSTFDSNLAESVDGAEGATTGGSGGGIANNGGTVTLTGSTITNNTAGRDGGGLSNRDGTVTLNNTDVSDNTVYCYREPSGGGISNLGGDLTVGNGSEISDNAVYIDGCEGAVGSGGGGGIFTREGAVNVTDSAISDNTVDGAEGTAAGGGIAATDSTITVDNSQISGNEVGQIISSGAGIDAVGSEIIIQNGSEISGNLNHTTEETALSNLGGGIRTLSSDLDISDSSITGNNAGASSGGGVAYVVDGAEGSFSIVNTNIDNNAAGDAGGGIFYDGAEGAQATLNGVTFDGNTPGCIKDLTNSKLVEPVDGSEQGRAFAGTCASEIITLAAENRILDAGRGNDSIRPSGGRQRLIGGVGADTFVYDSIEQLGSVIMDFDTTEDVIDMSELMSSIGNSDDPLSNGVITFRDIARRHTIVKLDTDGSDGPEVSKAYLTLMNVSFDELDEDSFVFGSNCAWGDDMWGDGTITDVEPNNTIASAQNIDGNFSLTSNADIYDSTTVPHVSISGTGNGTFDYYSFTANDCNTVMFDIDGNSFDTELFLYDLSGNLLAANDDGTYEGDAADSYPSFLSYDFSADTGAGTYVIGVGQFSSDGGDGGITGATPPEGGTYTLHVSINGL